MNDVNRQKRQNKSTLRQRQAQATAGAIVAAAKSLFLEQGYSSTTMESIAERAEVAISTVYAVFGSKRGILRAIRADWHEISRIREVALGDPGSASPQERIEILARATLQQWENGFEVTAIYRGAAAADPEAAAELNQALEGRRRGMEHFAKTLEPRLRPGLDVDHAAAILQALCWSEVYTQLVQHSGWTAAEYEAWLARILKHELLGLSE